MPVSAAPHETDHDYVVIGAGMGGLTVASLLAAGGARVAVIEAHEYPGGCCHTFPMGDYRFCAAVHYIFSCGEGEPVYNLLRKLDLHRTITFERLDPEGFDHFRCPSRGLEFRIPNGLDTWCERLADRFPAEAAGIRRFFAIAGPVSRQARGLPEIRSTLDMIRAAASAPRVLRHLRHTLQDVLDHCQLSPPVQAILCTQLGDLGLPPSRVSFLVYCALISAYGAGAYYPTEHFGALIEAIAGVIETAPGCAIAYDSEVTRVDTAGGRITAVETADGRRFRGDRFICNADPRHFVSLVGRQHFDRRFLRSVDYEYSASSFSIYLGVRGLDLRDHGFGNWNVWHYPHLDINRMYAAQNDRGDLSNPWLFMSTPTLYSPHSEKRHAPGNDQILEIITTCAFEPFAAAWRRGRRDYRRFKRQIRERMLDIVATHYVPGLRDHIALRVAGSPTTNRRYLWAPRGNIYGSELTPANVSASRLGPESSIENLYFTGASAAFPSIGGTVVGGSQLYTRLTGDPVNPARDRQSR